MRTKRELLILLRNKIKHRKIIPAGLCFEINQLSHRGLTRDEYFKLSNFIHTHKPRKPYNDPVFPGFYWKPGQVAPRMRWLNKHIILQTWSHFFGA